MATTLLLRRSRNLKTTLLRPLCTTPQPQPQPLTDNTTTATTPSETRLTDPSNPTHLPARYETRERLFEKWTKHLQPGFTPSDVNKALLAQRDPALAMDIFRWTALQRGYKHDETTYLTLFNFSLKTRRIAQAGTLLDEILAGIVDPSVPLYNSLMHGCSVHPVLRDRVFDVYKRMLKFSDCKPDLETYRVLFRVLLSKFKSLNIAYMYMNSVRSLSFQMKRYGIVPDSYVLNMIIKAFSRCRYMEEAVRVFKEMGLYSVEPDRWSYSYLVIGYCQKGDVREGLRYFNEMKKKGFVGTDSCWMILACSLALDRRFDEAAKVMREMIKHKISPDMLTYRTLFEEMCRDRKGNEAMELLEEFRVKDEKMGVGNYELLVNEMLL